MTRLNKTFFPALYLILLHPPTIAFLNVDLLSITGVKKLLTCSLKYDTIPILLTEMISTKTCKVSKHS